MAENTVERLHIDPYKDLPTTPVMAKETHGQLAAVRQALPQYAHFFNGDAIEHCGMGLLPEVGGTTLLALQPVLGFTPNEWSVFNAVFKQHAPDFEIIRYEKRVLLLNLRAAERVILQNPATFPKVAAQNPRQWLIGNFNEWHISGDRDQDSTVEIRYGLISGFPKWSVEGFSRYQRLLQIVVASPNFQDMQERELLQKLQAGDLTQSENIALLLRLNLVTPSLSSEERNLLIKKHDVRGLKDSLRYMGFDRNKDENYIQRLQQIATLINS